MGLLDDNETKTPTQPHFTITMANGKTWTTSLTEPYRYSIDAGVLAVFKVDADGNRLPGARYYSPTAWIDLREHEPRDRKSPFRFTAANG